MQESLEVHVVTVVLASLSGFLAGWAVSRRKAAVPIIVSNSAPERLPDPASYELAIALIDQQLQVFWLVFGGLLLAETVLLGGIMSISKDGSPFVVLLGAGLGCYLVLPWWRSFNHNHALYVLRIMQARSFEADGKGFFHEGQSLIDGDEVRGVKMSGAARPQWAIASLVVVVGGAFFGMVVFALWRIVWAG